MFSFLCMRCVEVACSDLMVTEIVLHVPKQSSSKQKRGDNTFAVLFVDLSLLSMLLFW